MGSWRREEPALAAERYWNADFETLDPERLRQHEARLLSRVVAYAARRSPWYARRLGRVGAEPCDVQTHEDLARLPLLQKSEIAELQAESSGPDPIGPHLGADWSEVRRVQATGGTTTQPLRFAMTALDIAVYEEMGARALWAMGCRPGDTVVHTMNYSLYAGGVSDHMAFERLGAAVLPYGVGRSLRLLALLRDLTKSPGLSLYATPSYMLRLIEVAREQGIEPRRLGLKKAFLSGEAGVQMRGFRDRVERTFGCAVSDLYGTAETGSQSGECPDRSGLHFGGAGLVLPELVDSATNRPVAFRNGAEGELVLTTLVREACPLVRFRTGDIVRVHLGPCACGRKTFRFYVQGRADDMFTVKGVNVFPSAIQAALAQLGDELTGAFQVVLPVAPFGDPILRVEAHGPESASERVTRVKSAVLDAVGWTPVVKLEAPGRLTGLGEAGGKSRWVKRLGSSGQMGDLDQLELAR